MIGNSRLHWGQFQGSLLEGIRHTPHSVIPDEVTNLICVASVVPSQTTWIQSQLPQAKPMTLADIPLKNIYPQLGIDRALAVWGASQVYGYPCLVIDGGTALTFSGVDGSLAWAGGAILPGLQLQFTSLAQYTAALPEVRLPAQLPQRWAHETPEAITSGITYTLLAGIQDFIAAWQQRFPHSPIISTGGDGHWIAQNLPGVVHDPNLIFHGFATLIQES